MICWQRQYDPERMEMNMDLRSESEELLYRGILPVAMSGRIVPCHAWADGTLLPVLAGFDDPDPDDDGDDDDGDDDDAGTDDEDADDDDDGDDDDEDPDKIKDPKRRDAARQAARYRVQRNEAREARDQARSEVTDLKAKLKAAEAAGSGDDSLKERIKELEADVASKDAKLSELESASKGVATERQVRAVASEMNISEDAELIMFRLNKAGVKADEDGQIDNLKQHLRKLIRRGKLSVKDGDDDDGEGDVDDDTTRTSGRSSGRTMNGKRKSKTVLDQKSMEARFPAIRR